VGTQKERQDQKEKKSEKKKKPTKEGLGIQIFIGRNLKIMSSFPSVFSLGL
jgi:hypothetical protein